MWEVFEKFVTRDKLKSIMNGCGPAKLGALVPDFGQTELCNQHDLLYSLGFSREGKHVIDSWFIAKLRAAGLSRSVLSLVCLALDNTNFNRRPLGPFMALPQADIALLRYELTVYILADMQHMLLPAAKSAAQTSMTN